MLPQGGNSRGKGVGQIPHVRAKFGGRLESGGSMGQAKTEKSSRTDTGPQLTENEGVRSLFTEPLQGGGGASSSVQVVQSAVGLSGDAGHVAAEFVERSAEQLDNMYIGSEVSQEDLASDNRVEVFRGDGCIGAAAQTRARHNGYQADADSTLHPYPKSEVEPLDKDARPPLEHTQGVKGRTLQGEATFSAANCQGEGDRSDNGCGGLGVKVSDSSTHNNPVTWGDMSEATCRSLKQLEVLEAEARAVQGDNQDRILVQRASWLRLIEFTTQAYQGMASLERRVQHLSDKGFVDLALPSLLGSKPPVIPNPLSPKVNPCLAQVSPDRSDASTHRGVGNKGGVCIDRVSEIEGQFGVAISKPASAVSTQTAEATSATAELGHNSVNVRGNSRDKGVAFGGHMVSEGGSVFQVGDRLDGKVIGVGQDFLRVDVGFMEGRVLVQPASLLGQFCPGDEILAMTVQQVQGELVLSLVDPELQSGTSLHEASPIVPADVLPVGSAKTDMHPASTSHVPTKEVGSHHLVQPKRGLGERSKHRLKEEGLLSLCFAHFNGQCQRKRCKFSHTATPEQVSRLHELLEEDRLDKELGSKISDTRKVHEQDCLHTASSRPATPRSGTSPLAVPQAKVPHDVQATGQPTKTLKDCREFLTRGSCKFGDDCHYHHDASHRRHFQEAKSLRICYQYTVGSCFRGDRCKFPHVSAPAAGIPSIQPPVHEASAPLSATSHSWPGVVCEQGSGEYPVIPPPVAPATSDSHILDDWSRASQNSQTRFAYPTYRDTLVAGMRIPRPFPVRHQQQVLLTASYGKQISEAEANRQSVKSCVGRRSRSVGRSWQEQEGQWRCERRRRFSLASHTGATQATPKPQVGVRECISLAKYGRRLGFRFSRCTDVLADSETESVASAPAALVLPDPHVPQVPQTISSRWADVDDESLCSDVPLSEWWNSLSASPVPPGQETEQSNGERPRCTGGVVRAVLCNAYARAAGPVRTYGLMGEAWHPGTVANVRVTLQSPTKNGQRCFLNSGVYGYSRVGLGGLGCISQGSASASCGLELAHGFGCISQGSASASCKQSSISRSPSPEPLGFSPVSVTRVILSRVYRNAASRVQPRSCAAPLCVPECVATPSRELRPVYVMSSGFYGYSKISSFPLSCLELWSARARSSKAESLQLPVEALAASLSPTKVESLPLTASSVGPWLCVTQESASASCVAGSKSGSQQPEMQGSASASCNINFARKGRVFDIWSWTDSEEDGEPSRDNTGGLTSPLKDTGSTTKLAKPAGPWWDTPRSASDTSPNPTCYLGYSPIVDKTPAKEDRTQSRLFNSTKGFRVRVHRVSKT